MQGMTQFRLFPDPRLLQCPGVELSAADIIYFLIRAAMPIAPGRLFLWLQ